MSECYSTVFYARLSLNEIQNLSVGISFALLLPVNFFTNLILAVSIVNSKQLINISNYLILLLSSMDCFQALTTLPLYIILFTTYRNEKVCQLEHATQVVAYFNAHMSGYLIFIIAFNRYLSINPDFRSHEGIRAKLASKTGSAILVSISLLFSCIHAILSYFGYKVSRIPTVLIGIIDVIIVGIVYVLYIKVYMKVKRFTRQSVIWRESQQTTVSKNGKPKYVRRLATTVLFVLITVAACYLPFIILNMYLVYWKQIKKQNTTTAQRFLFFTFMVPVQLNSALNAMIILYRNRIFRQYAVQMISNLMPRRWRMDQEKDDERNSTDDKQMISNLIPRRWRMDQENDDETNRTSMQTTLL